MDRDDLRRIFEWDERLEASTYYEVLGVLEIADGAAIRAAFHGFAAVFHPDSHPEVDEETSAALHRIFQCGAEAYRVLSRADTRREYDLALTRGQLRLNHHVAPRDLARTSDIRTLGELCHSPAARRYAERAEALIDAGDLLAAKRELQLALREDGKNPDLEGRLDALDLALYAMGS